MLVLTGAQITTRVVVYKFCYCARVGRRAIKNFPVEPGRYFLEREHVDGEVGQQEYGGFLLAHAF